MTEVTENIALLIDAENAPQRKMQDILDDLTKRGPVTCKRAYGDWSKPHSFRNACDEFVLVDYLGDERPESSEAATGTDGTSEVAQQSDANLEKDLIALLTAAADEYGDDDGWTMNGKAAQAIQRQRPDFSPRAFGCAKFVGVVRKLSEHFDLQRVKRGAGEAYVYRVKTDE